MFTRRFFLYFISFLLLLSLAVGTTLNHTNKVSICSSEYSPESFEVKINDISPILNFILFSNEINPNLSQVSPNTSITADDFQHLCSQSTELYQYSTLSPPA